MAATEGQPEVLHVLLKHVLQQQQQQQLQQHGGDLLGTLQSPSEQLLSIGRAALKNGSKGHWAVTVSAVADVLGAEAVKSLWGALLAELQQQQQQQQLGPHLAQRSLERQLTGVFDAWVSCCATAVASQQAATTARLQQLVIEPYQQQQQQVLWLAYTRASAFWVTCASFAASAAHGAARWCGLPSSLLPASVQPNSKGSNSSSHGSLHPAGATATAAGAAPQGVAPSSSQLQERVTYPSASAAGDGAGNGQQRVTPEVLQQLQKLVRMPNEDERTAAAGRVYAAIVGKLPEQDEQVESHGDQAQQQFRLNEQRQAVVCACDALLQEWLAIRRLQMQELRAAVVGAATAAMATAAV
jgi:hypothetical protein